MTGDAAVVLGAAGGIGAAIVRALAADGHRVLGVDVGEADESLTALPQVIGHVIGDIRDARTVQRGFAALEERSLTATVLVTSAMAERRAPLEDLDEPAFRDVLDVLYVSAWRWSRELLVRRSDDRALSVVHVGSVHAFRAAGGFGAYSAAKAALLALTRAMAVEWGPRGLRCNAVAPGFVPVGRNAPRWEDPQALRRLTDRLPLRRATSADDVAQAVLFLASSRAASITGTCLPVDAGLLSSFGTDV